MRLRATRPWLAKHGPKSHRRTTLAFRLRRNSLVVFRVVQVSPVCTTAGSFAVRGHAGVNRVRFKGAIHGRGLAPGTYQITAHVPGGGPVLHVVLVIVESGIPSAHQLAAARNSNVCAMNVQPGLASVLFNAAPGDSSGAASGQADEPTLDQTPSASGIGNGDAGHGILGAAHALAPTQIAKQASNPFVIAALALAVALLGLAALPRAAVADPRLSALLVQHRAAFALAGAAALAAAIVALSLG